MAGERTSQALAPLVLLQELDEPRVLVHRIGSSKDHPVESRDEADLGQSKTVGPCEPRTAQLSFDPGECGARASLLLLQVGCLLRNTFLLQVEGVDERVESTISGATKPVS